MTIKNYENLPILEPTFRKNVRKLFFANRDGIVLATELSCAEDNDDFEEGGEYKSSK
jgi:hypothetical protein